MSLRNKKEQLLNKHNNTLINYLLEVHSKMKHILIYKNPLIKARKLQINLAFPLFIMGCRVQSIQKHPPFVQGSAIISVLS